MPKTKSGKRAMRKAKARYGKKAGERIMFATANKLKKQGKPGLHRALHGGRKKR